MFQLRLADPILPQSIPDFLEKIVLIAQMLCLAHAQLGKKKRTRQGEFRQYKGETRFTSFD